MSNELSVAKGSLLDVANKNQITLSEAFLNCDGVAIVDISSSMLTNDSRGGKTRFDVAREELEALQAKYPGKLAIIVFASEATFCSTGLLPYPNGSTALHKGLEMARMADSIPDFKFFVISDGEPDNEEHCLTIGRTFSNPIHTIYVGSETGGGREFLRRLSSLRQGKFDTSFRATNGLSDKIAGLLGG